MGKKIRVQRRGRGSPTFRASTHKRRTKAQYPLQKKEGKGTIKGKIEKIIHDPGRGSPLALLKFETGDKGYTIIPEGVSQGQQIQMGDEALIEIGNILPIGKIPEGTMVCNIELRPSDGGKIAKSSGSYATIVGHTKQGTLIKLPSGRTKYINDYCKAMIGIVSGAGRTERPFLKAGSKFHLMKTKGHKYPRTRGRAMIAAVHPYGSSKKGARKVTTVSHGAPPGKKVGLIAARGTGRKKKRR